jgi:acyl carrier protein
MGAEQASPSLQRMGGLKMIGKSHAVLILIIGAMIACDRTDSASTPSPAARPVQTTPRLSDAEALRLAQEILSSQFRKPAESFRSEMTMAQLDADELDMVEMVMEAEDRLKVVIPDELLEKVTGTAKPDELLKKLTVAKFAEVVKVAQPAH